MVHGRNSQRTTARTQAALSSQSQLPGAMTLEKDASDFQTMCQRGSWGPLTSLSLCPNLLVVNKVKLKSEDEGLY